MRVFLAIICSVILSTTVFAEFDHAPKSDGHVVKVIQAAEPADQTFTIFRKKKRMKTSNKVKRHNRSMAKKLKRKNDDTLRR